MKTSAVVLADSLSPSGDRLTTLQVCFPRFILAEFNTHRVMSRNFRSSRAVPVAKLIDEVRTDPFIPSQFTKNQAGMQGGEALSGRDQLLANDAWLRAARSAADHAEQLALAGVHKQYANRGLEPYLYVHGVISATDWDNFFALRDHPDAQPEFRELAQAIGAARMASKPTVRAYSPDDSAIHSWWHLPYVSDAERNDYSVELCRRLSAARCARVSYRPFDPNEDDHDSAWRIVDKLLGTPMHASPFEHQATPGSGEQGNFTGWNQWRHMIEAEQ